MIVVIAIIGILAAILVSSMVGYLKTARESRKEANAKTVYTAAQATVTSLEATDPLKNRTYTKNGNTTEFVEAVIKTKTSDETPAETQVDKLFGKIQEFIGSSNYEKFSEIVVVVKDGAGTSVTVKETSADEVITYPK